jgi:polyphosphate kinase 2 (PPK2 family)
LARIDEPEKNWKFSSADIAERKFWKQYMKAYETCLGATSTRDAQWYIVPADDKENARLIASKIILDTLERLKMTYPKTSAKRRRELLSIRKQLMK